MFSLYEPHNEWVSKGKSNKKVALGHAVCITTNQHHFCMHWQVMEKQHDVDMPLIIRDFIQSKHGKYRIESWSFDRNFGSPENREGLAEQVDCLVMPKKGRISKKEQKQQEEAEFKKYRKKHSTIEANINQLECLGAGKCRDKTIEGFKRYVGLSVLAYNLHRLGKIRRRY
ncbi:transposase [Microscilla marina]|nr:transposase [Microscilla marina]